MSFTCIRKQINFSADGIVYQAINELDIELYTDRKDLEAEKKVEAVLREHGFFYEKTETYLESEKMFEVLYEMEVITMPNKVKYNLKNTHYAKLTEGENGAITWGTRWRFPAP